MKLTPRANLLSRSRNANNDTLPPALVARLERRSHNANITRAIERVIAPPIRHLNQLLLDALLAQLRGVHKVRSAKLLRPALLVIINVHHDDFPRPVLDRALDDRQADAARAKHRHVRALLHLRRDDGRAVARRDAAAQQAGAVHGCLVRDGHDGDVGDDGVLRERRRAHEV